jgi:hypothetical protein
MKYEMDFFTHSEKVSPRVKRGVSTRAGDINTLAVVDSLALILA